VGHCSVTPATWATNRATKHRLHDVCVVTHRGIFDVEAWDRYARVPVVADRTKSLLPDGDRMHVNLGRRASGPTHLA
jgi:hypothetical protein